MKKKPRLTGTYCILDADLLNKNIYLVLLYKKSLTHKKIQGNIQCQHTKLEAVHQ